MHLIKKNLHVKISGMKYLITLTGSLYITLFLKTPEIHIYNGFKLELYTESWVQNLCYIK